MNNNDMKLLNDLDFNYGYALNAVDGNLRADHTRQMEEAQRTGASVTFRNDRMSSDFAERAMQSVSLARDDAMKAVGRALNEAKSILTDAPTTEEANYIIAVSQRDDLTRDEVDAALSRYTGHAVQHAIRAAAKRSGLKDIGITTDAENRVEMLNRLNEAVERDFSYFNIIGKSDAHRGVVRANYELILNSNGGEPSMREFGRAVFGDPLAPLD